VADSQNGRAGKTARLCDVIEACVRGRVCVCAIVRRRMQTALSDHAMIQASFSAMACISGLFPLTITRNVLSMSC